MNDSDLNHKIAKGCFSLLGLAILLASCASRVPESLPGAEQPSADSDATSTRSEVLPTTPGLEIMIDRISDGDSVRATSAEGDLEIRLIGVNAPEIDECFGDRSADLLEQLVGNARVTVHPWPPERDDFGRELGFLVADGQFVNLALIQAGAVVARAQSDHAFIGEFEDAETQARETQTGLWAPDACGTPSDAQLEIVDAEADAPGNDQENPNGEWVEIRNAGDSSASLRDWVLRDESTRHRYNFPDIDVNPGQRIRIFTGCGTDTLTASPGELYWCASEPPIWNNGGDTAFLLDPNGAIADSREVGG